MIASRNATVCPLSTGLRKGQHCDVQPPHRSIVYLFFSALVPHRHSLGLLKRYTICTQMWNFNGQPMGEHIIWIQKTVKLAFGSLCYRYKYFTSKPEKQFCKTYTHLASSTFSATLRSYLLSLLNGKSVKTTMMTPWNAYSRRKTNVYRSG